ncbi:MAG: Uma2 family endonuclease [Cyanobacteria bacterium P01_F01_bin.86]
MTQSITRPKLTFEEFLKYDDGTDNRYELTNEELVEVAPETDDNILLANWLAELLKPVFGWQLIRTHASTIEVTPLPGIPQSNRYPDLMVLTPELAEQLKGKSSAVRLTMPNPALVVEVVSPYAGPQDENYQRDYINKRRQYEQRRLPEYWILDPAAQKLTVLILKGATYQEQTFTGHDPIASSLSPSLQLTVEQILTGDR